MATPQVKDLVLRSPAGSSEVLTFSWPLQVGTGQDRHDNGIDIIDTIKFVCDELPSISSAFEEINLNHIDTACYKTMTNLVDRFNKAVDSIVALEKGTSLPAERLNKFAHPSLLRHILQLVYNAAVLDPDKLNNYEPFSPEVYGETSYELVQQMIKHVHVTNDDTFIDLGSGVGQVVLQMAGSFPLKSCVGVEKADTPARYAERMDIFFRQFMAWFGKRYCEYKLLKGDFLVDEHREKITSSSLVFVNNFAFGPNVDHQLKERFADLRDGARVVSSKSFCPLNFRITDRNLSDIGTIMHVSEIPPLKGSVSWTCKPVSYYLHVIDRTILERYFQRLKTQKGAENDHAGGTTRTTRDRAKREANNQASTNSQSSNFNSNTTRTNSPAAHVNNITTTKTRQQQQQQQQQHQQQRNMEIETSTESDGDANTTNGNSNCSGGPTMTRKVWSDWGSSKGGKSSQTEEEENNNFITTISRTVRTATQKKRKKLTRKVAIANKSSAAAAQREAAAKERAETAQASKDNSSKEDFGGNSTGGGSTATKGRKGRLKKGARGRKNIKIAGLDVLHQETLLSTSAEAMSKKLPPAPGTIDQQLTSLLTENMDHTELEIPEAPKDTPYALQILFDVFRSQYMAIIDQMKSKAFIPHIKRQIQVEQERKQRIKNRASQLDKQIKVLIDDSVALLKVRMNELGINVSSPNDLIAKAKEIVGRHKELQGVAKKIQSQVTSCELEQKRLLKKHLLYLPEYQRLCGINGKTKFHDFSGCELSETSAHELVLKEIANTLAQRKKLVTQVSNIEKEANILEKSLEERRTAAALLAQGTNIILTNPISSNTNNHINHNQPLQLTTNHNHSNALTINHANLANSSSSSCSLTLNPANNINSTTSLVPNNSASQPSITVTKTSSKSVKRSRDHRTRSQEWPDVPDVGKIEESNPEVLAQKILETGRKIEAGKLTSNSNTNSSKHQHQNIVNNHHHQLQHLQLQTQQHHLINQNHNQIQQHLPQHHPEDKPYRNKHHQSNHAHHHQQQLHQRSTSNEHLSSLGGYGGVAQDPSTLMPAPKQRDGNLLNAATSIRPLNNSNAMTSSILPKCELPGMRKSNNSNVPVVSIQESPKVANFEDRLKSIITSALNEDQEQRKAQQVVNQVQVEVSPSPHQSPVPKRNKHSHISTANNNLHAGSSSNHNSLSSIINVATHGMTHLNATTTISPITPALPPPQPPPPHGNSAGGSNSKYGSNKSMLLQPINSSMSSSQAVNSSSTKSLKYHQTHNPNPTNAHNQHLNNIYGAAEHNLHRRRSSVSAANYEQFIANQQREREHQLQQQQQHMMNMGQHNPHNLSLEFKQPPLNMESHIVQQRSSSREMLMEDPVPPVRTSSANSDSALQYYPPTRDRLMSLERSSSRDSGQLINPQQQPPSRPSSNSSQPDYTQVSPAKMALRRHLSQEKLNQVLPGSVGSGGSNSLPPMSSTKTIGDLVNGEIERTLEITHQSIINAAVNMSTVGSASGERNPYLLERSLYHNDRERDRSIDREHEREREKERERERDLLIVNNHAQRPERVHVKVTDDEVNPGNNYVDISPRSTSQSAQSGRKSPYAHNLATLANVAYQHKTIPAANSTTNNHQHHHLQQQQQHNSSSSASALRHSQRDRDLNNLSSYHLASSTATAAGKISLANSNSNPASSSTNRDYQPVALPRAEMKPCIEAYFHDQDHHHQSQPQQQQHLASAHNNKSGKERHASRSNRLNGTNPPLEGLAASLMASRKFREEHEERQKRAAAASNATGNHNSDHHVAAHGQHHQQNRQHHNVDHYNNSYGQQAASTLHNNHHNGSSMKVELGVKRTSPMTNNYPRSAKVARFSNDQPLTHGSSHTQNPYAITNGGVVNSSNSNHHHGHHNSPTSTNPDPAGCTNRRNKVSMEPLLMSPEINSIMGAEDARPMQQHASINNRQSSSIHNNSNSHQHGHGHYNNYHHQQQLQSQQVHHQHNSHHRHHLQNLNNRNANNNSATSSSSTASNALTNSNNIVGNRTADDDDVIADDESHWQHRVSSGFDRLVAFASTELDKTRRSIDTDIVPSSISCNTSPDSGITHSSSNSDAARTFLSTSSTSSQLDLPISSGSSTSSGNSSFMSHHGGHHHHNNLGGSQEHLSDSSMKSTHSDVNSMAIALKNCSSPQDPTAIDSPPLSDMGLPRTPSPNVAVNTPPPSSSSLLNSGNSLDNTSSSNNLKIPLKYQRKSKTSLEKHYKKKFCERNWEYDCDELLAYSNSSSNPAADAAGNANDQLDGGVSKDMDCLSNTTLEQQKQMHHHQQQQQQHHHHHNQQQHQHQHALHKSSKFRPKGKDWDWSMDSNSSSSQKAKCDLPSSALVVNPSSVALATTKAAQVMQ